MTDCSVLKVRSSEWLAARIGKAFAQRFAEPLGARVVERLVIGVRDEEDVFGAFADGQNLGVQQRDALLIEDLGDLEQKAGAVAGDELDDGASVVAVAR